MDAVAVIIGACLIVGGFVGFLVGRGWARREIEVERQVNAARLENMRDVFATAATDALRTNNEQFIALANEAFQRHQEGAVRDLGEREKAIHDLVRPVKESLERFDQKIQDVEKARVGAYEGLTTQVRSLFESQQQLRSETNNLVNALRSPRIRGRWGEIQLRRVVELAGMLDHCDFIEQESTTTEEGRLRPDMVVRLPGNKSIVIDAKTPLDAYLLALEATDDDSRAAHLANYAGHIRNHVAQLSKKAYWERVDSTPEMVFMFLPGESFYSAALEADPSLIEIGVNQRVILATPTTLIALLRAIAYGWQQKRLGDEVERIGNLGKELYERVRTLGGHFVGLGASLGKAVAKYNEAIGTLESRVLVSARRLKDMPITATDKEIEAMEQIETIPRQLQSPDFNGQGEQPILFNPETDYAQSGEQRPPAAE